MDKKLLKTKWYLVRIPRKGVRFARPAVVLNAGPFPSMTRAQAYLMQNNANLQRAGSYVSTKRGSEILEMHEGTVRFEEPPNGA